MKASKQHTVSFTLHGLAVSNGIAIGQAHLISQATLEVSHRVIAPRLAFADEKAVAAEIKKLFGDG